MDTALYDAYGLPIADTDVATGNSEAYQDPVGFGGQHGYYYDTETGLSLLTNRYYAPKTGRFITRDPIGYNGGINLYGFAGNDPVNRIDPSGTDDLPMDSMQYIGNMFNNLTPHDWLHALKHNDATRAVGVLLNAAMWIPLPENPTADAKAIELASEAIQAARMAREVAPVAPIVTNGIRGRAFEAAAIKALGAAKNNASLTGRTLAGVPKNTIPDIMGNNGITEIKDVAELSYTAQIQAQIYIAREEGIPFNLIVNGSTKISKPLINAVQRTGGSIRIFNPSTRLLQPYP